MKRVLFILPSLTMGGLERVQVTLANALQRIGYDVTVMILDDNRELEDELDNRVTLFRKVYKTHLGQSVPYLRTRYYDDGMWESRATPEELYRYYVGDEHYDIEVAFFHGLPVKIISGSTNMDALHFAWIHNDFTKIRGYQFNFTSLEDVRAAYQRLDAVVCVSESARKGFISTIGDTGNTTTIYNILPTMRIQRLSRKEIAYRYPTDSFNLVLVGRLKDSHKGQRRLISVVARLNREGRKVTLALVGDGSDREAIERAIDQHHAQDFVYMAGNQRNPYPYVSGADMLICASYYEGFNLTVAEAMILGVPVISTKCTGPCEILDNGKYGLLVENSRKGLYYGIKLMADNPNLVRLYRQKAKKRFEFFSEETILRQIVDLMEQTNKTMINDVD